MVNVIGIVAQLELLRQQRNATTNTLSVKLRRNVTKWSKTLKYLYLFNIMSFEKKAFGKEVVEHYVHFYKTELAAYEHSVTDWEKRRYFKQI